MGDLFKGAARAVTAIVSGGTSEIARTGVLGKGAKDVSKKASGIVQSTLFSPESAAFAAGVATPSVLKALPAFSSLKLPGFLKDMSFDMPTFSGGISIPNTDLRLPEVGSFFGQPFFLPQAQRDPIDRGVQKTEREKLPPSMPPSGSERGFFETNLIPILLVIGGVVVVVLIRK